MSCSINKINQCIIDLNQDLNPIFNWSVGISFRILPVFFSETD